MGRLVPDKMVIEHKVTFENIKSHIRDNKSAYISGLAGAGIGVIATLVLRKPQLVNVASPVFNNAPVFNNSNQQINFGGYSHKIVKCLETGEIWETAKGAAEAAGITPAVMSKHLNGHTDHVKGLHFEILGVGTAG